MPAHLLSLPLFTVECIDSASGACRRGLDWENPGRFLFWLSSVLMRVGIHIWFWEWILSSGGSQHLVLFCDVLRMGSTVSSSLIKI